MENEELTNLVDSLIHNTSYIVKNTTADFVWDGVCFIGILSLALSALTVYSIWKEFNNDRIDRECQKLLFHDIIRHLYRNKICTLAMRAKYCKEASIRKYPSDEHYLKLKLLPSDIHTEQFYKDAKKFDCLHEIDLLLRNYNTEIEVALNHMVNSTVPEEAKMRDFDTLDFKTGYLTHRILGVMKEIWPNEDHRKKAMNIISESHSKNLETQNNQTLWGWEFEDVLKNLRENEIKNDFYFLKIFNEDEIEQQQLQEMLKLDTIIECGKNQKKEEKIYIIKWEDANA